jgi:hypothetical protein
MSEPTWRDHRTGRGVHAHETIARDGRATSTAHILVKPNQGMCVNLFRNRGRRIIPDRCENRTLSMRDQARAHMRFRIVPIFSISTSHTSPSFR